jgi:hypothetical protein
VKGTEHFILLRWFRPGTRTMGTEALLALDPTPPPAFAAVCGGG